VSDTQAATGHIIYLNGASSAGKTSIGRELRQVLAEPHLLLGIDTFIMMMPPRLFGTEDGHRFVPSSDGALTPVEGPVARRVFGAMYSAVAALSRAGNHVIFDDVMTSQPRLRTLLDAWQGHDVLLVGVRCDSAVAEEREQARGDRIIGLARGTSGIVHEHMEYDIEVDTGVMDAAACANAICAHVSTQQPQALARLNARLMP
jgi:chloramphenicol 3-O phosphotransferase